MNPILFKSLRQKHGLTQAEFASLFGKHRNVILAYENNRAPIPRSVANFCLVLSELNAETVQHLVALIEADADH